MNDNKKTGSSTRSGEATCWGSMGTKNPILFSVLFLRPQEWLSRVLWRQLGSPTDSCDLPEPPPLGKLFPRESQLAWDLATLYIDHGLTLQPPRQRSSIRPWRYLGHLLLSALIGALATWIFLL